jgi:hypothetical protein
VHLLALTIATASAWTLHTTADGDPVRWTGFPVRYALDARPDDPVPDADAILAYAFAAWEGHGSVPVAFLADPTSENRIGFSDDWPFDPDLLAVTTPTSNEDGELVAFEIRINANQPWATDGDASAYDLQAALAHEIGHALGIEHSEIEAATMFASIGTGDRSRRALHDDDHAALTYLYAEPEPLPPTEVVPLSCNTSGASAGWLALLGVLGMRRRM